VTGSLAFDAGDPAAVAGVGGVPVFDQRGSGFPRVFNGRVDIGASESQTVIQPLAGDYNRSGAVDAADFVVWRKTNGTVVPPFSGADGNGNGVVDQADYLIWRANFHSSPSTTAASAAVVETPSAPDTSSQRTGRIAPRAAFSPRQDALLTTLLDIRAPLAQTMDAVATGPATAHDVSIQQVGETLNAVDRAFGLLGSE
jgi:hypothetical protein